MDLLKKLMATQNSTSKILLRIIFFLIIAQLDEHRARSLYSKILNILICQKKNLKLIKKKGYLRITLIGNIFYE